MTTNEQQIADSLVGTNFAGRFQIQSLLGEGAMGVVYLARHVVLERLFAIKVIQKSLITDVNISARFRREARAASRVQHRNVTAVVDFGHTEDGRPYLVMEYAEGETLAEAIKRGGAMQPLRALRILRQVASALVAAHAGQVVHRDLKPQNIVLTTARGKADVVKVLDFGLAKIVGIGSTRLTRAGEALGTPDYISPEQCTATEEADPRSDIYSFGAMMYHLLVGRPPFKGTVVQKVGAHLHRKPPAPSSSNPTLVRSIDDLVLRCMAKKPDQRHQSAADLLAAIDEIREELGDHAGDDESSTIGYSALTAGHKTHDNPDGWDDESTLDWGSQTDQIPQPSIDEIACSLRDRGLGSSQISAALAQKIAAEDRVYSIRSELATLEGNLTEIETSARQREARLRQALAQLEHEKSLLRRDQRPPAGRQTKLLGRQQAVSGEHDNRAVLLEENAIGIARSLRQLSEKTDQRLNALQKQITRQRDQLATAQVEASRHHDELARLVSEVG